MDRAGKLVYLAAGLVFTSAHKIEFPTGYPDKCPSTGGHHKAAPSPETGEFPVCAEWKSMSCCHQAGASEYHVEKSPAINHLNRTCGPLSDRCSRYLVAQGCFYNCEPMLQRFELENHPGFFEHAPICGSYCDDWYEACKDDRTCVRNWVTAFYSGNRQTDCAGEECVTFKQMYGSGTHLCNQILGSEYIYEPSNRNCMVMQFSGENPNTRGQPYTAAAAPVAPSPHQDCSNQAETSTLKAVLGLLYLLVLFNIFIFLLFVWLKRRAISSGFKEQPFYPLKSANEVS